MNLSQIVDKPITHGFSIEEMKFAVEWYIHQKKNTRVNIMIHPSMIFHVELLNIAFNHAYIYGRSNI